jgi:hypothetical protein
MIGKIIFECVLKKLNFREIYNILIYYKMTAWNDFVKKIYHEGRKKNGKEFTFGKALKEASKRKSEMSGGSPYGSSIKAASVPSADGIDGQGITQGTGQSGPLTAALTASGGARKTKRRKSSRRKGKKGTRKTRRHRKK